MQIPCSFSPRHRGRAFPGRYMHDGRMKLLVKPVITGCGSGTRETGAREPSGVKGRACIWQVSGSSVCVVWSCWWLLSSMRRTERQGWSWPHRSLGSWGAPAAGYGFTEPLGWNFWELSVGGGGHTECTKQGTPGGSSARITAAFAPAPPPSCQGGGGEL